jgi:hypothetical protein
MEVVFDIMNHEVTYGSLKAEYLSAQTMLCLLSAFAVGSFESISLTLTNSLRWGLFERPRPP